MQGRVVFIEKHNAALAHGLLKQLTETRQRIGCHHGVNEGGSSLEQVALLIAEGIRVDIVAMLPPRTRNLLADAADDSLGACTLGRRKGERNDGPGTLFAAQIGVAPDIEPVKEVGPRGVLVREEALDHIHVEGFAKTARAADERHLVGRMPPVGDKGGLVNQEISALTQLGKALYPYRHRPRHTPPFHLYQLA